MEKEPRQAGDGDDGGVDDAGAGSDTDDDDGADVDSDAGVDDVDSTAGDAADEEEQAAPRSTAGCSVGVGKFSGLKVKGSSSVGKAPRAVVHKTRAETERKLCQLGLPVWQRVKNNPWFLWLKAADVEKVEKAEKQLAAFEGISPAVWGNMYKLYHMVKGGISDKAAYTQLSQTTLKLWKKTYRLENSIHTYEHMLLFHGFELQERQNGRPLGIFSNQLDEHEHHNHKIGSQHTFGNGKRQVGKKGEKELEHTDEVCEIMIRSCVKQLCAAQTPSPVVEFSSQGNHYRHNSSEPKKKK